MSGQLQHWQTLFAQKLGGMQAQLETELRASIACCIQDFNAMGYAISIGEDLELASPIAITCPHPAAQHKPDAVPRNCDPMEWPDWHHKHFLGYAQRYDEMYQACRQEYDLFEDCSFTLQGEAFMLALHAMYLDSMQKMPAAFPSMRYWAITIPDSEYAIVTDSIKRLNTPEVLQKMNLADL
ncbi:hypothetical protein V8J88_24595 [Massilia sp. W12]|uniref:hypothetical protein n=1 Tax=Massilia sp. W12 TaxID=3126507 RepID=UPI0030CC4712